MTATLNTTRPAPPPHRQLPKRRKSYYAFLVVLTVSSVGTTLMLLSAYLPLDPLQSRLPTQNGFHFAVLVTHLFTGGLALSLGSLQFLPWLRAKHRRLHRWVGRAYLFAGVFPSAIFGVGASVMATIGMPSAVPLTILSLLWLGSGVLGLKAIRERRFADHREWMIRNFALTATAITGRLFSVPIVVFFEPPASAGATALEIFNHDITSLLNWGAFTTHLLIAEWYIQRGRRKARVSS